MELRTKTANLALAEEFGISRGSRTTQSVVQVELEHDGVTGRGEAAPVYYRGETIETATAFLTEVAPSLMRDDPFALEAIDERMARTRCRGPRRPRRGAPRLDRAEARRAGLAPARPLARARPAHLVHDQHRQRRGTRDRARRARGFRALKIKVGGPEDLARLEAVRAESRVPLRVDANEGWTLEGARELMPALLELGVEFVEQPFPADDLDSHRALRELSERPPVVIDEGCHDLADVAAVAGYADGINVKLAKCGGIREALRMIHAARALGLRVMLGCMIESQLGIAPAASISSLVDWVDLDGHLLLEDQPYTGLRLVDGHVLPSGGAGLGLAAAGVAA